MKDMNQQDHREDFPEAFLPRLSQKAFCLRRDRHHWWRNCQVVPQETGSTDPAHLLVAVEPERPFLTVQDSQRRTLWVFQDPQGSTDHTWKGEDIVHIPAASSFVDRGNIHKPQG